MTPELRAELNEIWQRIIEIEKKAENKTNESAVALAANQCQRGKYRGKLLTDIVQKDPQYVCWLEANNLATGIGFTAEHCEQAAAQLAANPPERTR